MSKHVTQAGWADAPHLTEEAKAEIRASIPIYQLEARSKGIPTLGSGAIYPVAEEDIIVDPFQIPSWWPRSYGMDVGWNRTAAVFQAHDRETDIVYLFGEWYRGQAEPAVHAAGIRAVASSWMLGTIDPASRGRGQADGQQLFQAYQDLGLQLVLAKNGVEAGIHEVWTRLSTGRLKVFSTLQNWRGEYRLYRRDEKGSPVKKDDHLMDATRYLIVTGLGIEGLAPDYIAKSGYQRNQAQHQVEYNPLSRERVTGMTHQSDYVYDPRR